MIEERSGLLLVDFLRAAADVAAADVALAAVAADGGAAAAAVSQSALNAHEPLQQGIEQLFKLQWKETNGLFLS